MEVPRPVSPLTGEDGWAAGRAGDLLPSPASDRGVPCSPLPASPTRVHAPLSLPCHHAGSIIVRTLSSCTLRHLACSIFVRAPSLCTLRRCTRSIFMGAPSWQALHCRARSVTVHTVVQAPSLCMLCLHVCSVMRALSCVLHRRARSFVTPACGHRGQPRIRQPVAGWALRGHPCPSPGHELHPPSHCLPGSGTSPAGKG